MVVRTIRKERRGLDRARRVERVRFKELTGRFAEAVVRTDEASGAMTGSAAAEGSVSAAAVCASLRAFCRRRCGRSISGVAPANGDTSFFAGRGGSDAVNDVDVDDRPLETTASPREERVVEKVTSSQSLCLLALGQNGP